MRESLAERAIKLIAHGANTLGSRAQSKSLFTFENDRCIGDSQRFWLDPDHGVFEGGLDKIVIRLLCSNMLASVAGHNIS